MNKKAVITAMLTLVAMAGQGQIHLYVFDRRGEQVRGLRCKV